MFHSGFPISKSLSFTLYLCCISFSLIIQQQHHHTRNNQWLKITVLCFFVYSCMSHFLCIWQKYLLTLPHSSGAQELPRIRQFCRVSIYFPSSCTAFLEVHCTYWNAASNTGSHRHGNPFHSQHQKQPSAEDKLCLCLLLGPCPQCLKLSSGLEGGGDMQTHISSKSNGEYLTTVLEMDGMTQKERAS